MPENNTETQEKTNDESSREVQEVTRKRLQEIGYENDQYQKAKKRVIDIIPSVSIWEAIDKYAGSVSLGIFGIAMGSIFRQNSTPRPLKDPTTRWLAGSALATALLGIFAHYKKTSLSKPAEIDHKEGYTEVTARLTGDAVGRAVSESIAPHLKELKNKRCQSETKWREHAEKKNEANLEHALM